MLKFETTVRLLIIHPVFVSARTRNVRLRHLLLFLLLLPSMKESWRYASHWLSKAFRESPLSSHHHQPDQARWVNTVRRSLPVSGPSQCTRQFLVIPSAALDLQPTTSLSRFCSSATPSNASFTPPTTAPATSLLAGRAVPPQQPDKDVAEALRSKQLQAFQIQVNQLARVLRCTSTCLSPHFAGAVSQFLARRRFFLSPASLFLFALTCRITCLEP